jgi:hypothetical protein
MSDQPVAEAATCTTQQTQETSIHALIGIRTRDPSSQTAADLRLRPHKHREQGQINHFLSLYFSRHSCVDSSAMFIELRSLFLLASNLL